MKNKKIYVCILILIIILISNNRAFAVDGKDSELLERVIYANKYVLKDGEYDPDVNVETINGSHMNYKIKANSASSIIEELKYAKKTSVNEDIDYTTAGIALEITPSSSIEIVHEFTEEGIYEIYARTQENSAMKFKFCAYRTFPVTVTEMSSVAKTKTFKINSKFCNIEQVKIISEDTLVEETMTITPAKEVTVEYTGESGNYQIDVYDEMRCHKIVYFSIGSAPTLNIEKDDNNKRKITISAASDGNIESIKYAKQSRKNEEIDFSTSGIDIPITPAKQITMNYEFSEDGVYSVCAQNAIGGTIIWNLSIYRDFPVNINIISIDNKTITFEVVGSFMEIVDVKIKNNKTGEIESINIIPNKKLTIQHTLLQYGDYTIIATDDIDDQLSSEFRLSEEGIIPLTIVESEKYEVNGIKKIITEIPEKTSVTEFIRNIDTGGEDYTIHNSIGGIISDTDYVGTGSKLKVGDEEYTLIVKGDLDGNGEITITDVSKIKLHFIGLEELQGSFLLAGQLTESGKVTITDVSKIKLHFIGLEQIK